MFSPKMVKIADSESQNLTTLRQHPQRSSRLSPINKDKLDKSSKGKLKDFLKKKQHSNFMKELQRKALDSYYTKRTTVTDMKKVAQRLYEGTKKKSPNPFDDELTNYGEMKVRYKKKPQLPQIPQFGIGSKGSRVGCGQRLPQISQKLRTGSVSTGYTQNKPETTDRVFSSIDFSKIPISKLELRKARRGNAVYCSTSMNVRPEDRGRLSSMQPFLPKSIH